MQNIKNIVIGVFAIVITLFIILITFYFLGYEEIVYVMLALGFSVYTLLIFFSGVGISIYFSTDLLKTGAGIALKAKESDDKADTALINSITKVFSIGASAGQKVGSNISNNEMPNVDISLPDEWNPPTFEIKKIGVDTNFDES